MIFKEHRLKKYYSLIILILFAIVEIQVQTSCANIIPPTGGPRDTVPPVLVQAVPADSSLHFSAKKIVLTFDEYIQVDPQLTQSIITSPNPIQQPYTEGHLKTVTIRLKDSLQPNTTYSINFGNAIKDINENNPYKKFTYVFSTGSNIANGSLSGKVVLAQTGAVDSTLLVILHKNLNDTAIKKDRPFYYTNLDSAGRFNFRFLAYGTYNVFVLPNDYTKKYDDSTKTFAFLNAPVIIDSTASQPPLMLYAYNEFKPEKTSSSSTTETNNNNKPQKKKNNDTTLTFVTNLQRNQQDLLSDLIIQFHKPLAHFDSGKIIFSDTNYHPIKNYSITNDSLTAFYLKYAWREDEAFKLIIQKNAFTDSAGHTLAKNDTLNFKTNSESEYGSLRLQFSNLDTSKHPVLQFVQNNAIVDSVALTSNIFYRKLFKPGDYDLRVLYDADNNMTWTPGNYELKKQPEIVVRIPKKLQLKSNWDNETNVIL